MRTKEHIIGPIVLLLMMVCYIIFNFMTPLLLDDCCYANSGHTWADIVRTQHHAYLHDNGRILAHTVVQIFAGMIGKTVFNVLNAIMVTLLVYLLCMVSDKNYSVTSMMQLALAVFLVWFCYPDQYVTMFMISGSVNFVWASVVILLFLVLFFNQKLSEKQYMTLALLCLYSLIAGLWGEMYSVCVTPALLILLCIDRTKRNRVSWLMLLFFAIGAAIMVLAPGNYSRMLNINAGGSVAMATRFVNTVINILRGNLYILWFAIVLLWLYVRYVKKINGFWKKTRFWWLAILFSLAFTIVSGASYQRTFFAIYTFSFVILLKLAILVDINKQFSLVSLFIILIVVGIDFCNELKIMKIQKYAVDYCYTKEAVDGYLPWLGGKTSQKSLSSNVLSNRANSWKNKNFCQYHGIDVFSVLPKEVFADLVCPIEISEKQNEHKYVIIRLDDERIVESVKITYTDDEVYIFPQKLARLMDACGFQMRKKYYNNNSQWYGFLLRKEKGLSWNLINMADYDNFGVVHNATGMFLYFHKRNINWGSLEAKRIEPQY